ncbi:uncharacterized protein LOC112043112 [Bicyclus anynana]|uniref:Uncharacterized protein LOC112043112 n=1 Tax=Bicyclus anynana TaxID=110368 RepID=A0A6J1MIJ0_BICAN|nr:uncharacterized protein LOC112043112 [Bicyclus anynana]
MDLKTIRLLFNATLRMKFDYVMDGLLLSLFPVYGSGKGELRLEKMQMEMLLVFDIIKNDNGEDVINLKTYYFGYDTAGGVNAHFDNAFNGDKKKSEVFHKLINRSWRVMMANFAIVFQNKITQKLFDGGKKFLLSYDLADLVVLN